MFYHNNLVNNQQAYSVLLSVFVENLGGLTR